jgi:adenylate kinase family enzyme
MRHVNGIGHIGRRIAIYGPTGSGKTTFGRALGQRLGLPVIDLDTIFWLPN